QNFPLSTSRNTSSFSGGQRPGDAESIIRVLELRRNAGPRRRARNLNMMAPRAAPRSLARAALWPLRISFRRMRVVPVVVPVGAPFMDVVAHVVQPVSVRLIQPHRLRPELPSFVVIGNCFRRRVSPRV